MVVWLLVLILILKVVCLCLSVILLVQKYTDEAAELKLLHNGKVKVVKVNLQAPVRLIPFHIKGKPPSYFIVAGLVFTPATVPYLRSEYGKEYDFDAPVGPT
jgi:hypothetical protein